ncbi:MAG: nucleotide exchange factor GrpE [Micromonosporaceae bacterium]
MTDQEPFQAAGGEAETEADVDASADASAEASAEELRARVAELEDRWRRTLADLDNLRKRTAREKERLQLQERARLAAEWLPLLDNLELALEHAEADPDSIVEGVRQVRDQAIAVMGRLGFPRRSDLGARFDPARHEAVAEVPDDEAPEGAVVRVIRPGYGDDQQQLRPAAVVVAKKAD